MADPRTSLEPVEPDARPRRRLSGSLIWVVPTTVLILAVAIGIAVRHHGTVTQPTAMPLPLARLADGAPSTFVTVEDRSGPEGNTLMLSDSRTGRKIRDLMYAGADQVEAVRAGDGSIVTVTNGDCAATIGRIAADTGRRSALRKLAQAPVDIALSPDGRRLAFLKVSPCVIPCHGKCSGPSSGPPNALVILDLRTGTEVSTTLDVALTGLGWSPDGTHMVVAVRDTQNQLIDVDAAHPDLATAPRITAPRGCGYVDPSWTTAGIVAGEGCDAGPIQSLTRLVRLNPAGTITGTWSLPVCVDDATTAVDPGSAHVLAVLDIEHNDSVRCRSPWGRGVVALEPHTLRPLIEETGPQSVIMTADW